MIVRSTSALASEAINALRSSRLIDLTLAVCIFLAGSFQAIGQEQSTQPLKLITQTFPAKDWNGKHSLPDVYCIDFPSPQTARHLDSGFYSNGAVYFTSVEYPNRLTVKILSSTIPAGRSAEAEIARLLANEKRNEQSTDLVFDVIELNSQFGPMIGLAVRNIQDNDPARPYPLVKPFYKPADGKVHSIGVHRLFVRGPDRFEIAVLQELERPVSFGSESEAKKKATAMLDQVVASLQSCTAKLPPRNQASSADVLDKVIDDIFPRQNSKLICSPPGSSRDSIRATLKSRLASVDMNEASAANAIAAAIYTQFPCPISPYRSELRPVKAEDLIGDWLFPQASQKLRFGPKSPLWQSSAGVPQINCEAVSYFENGRQLTAQIGGTLGGCITAADMKKAASLPAVEGWTLIGDGRLKVTRTDVPNHIEEWEIFLVEKPFDIEGIHIAVNDLIAYRRRDVGNDFNAATMFRHLQRMR